MSNQNGNGQEFVHLIPENGTNANNDNQKQQKKPLTAFVQIVDPAEPNYKLMKVELSQNCSTVAEHATFLLNKINESQGSVIDFQLDCPVELASVLKEDTFLMDHNVPLDGDFTYTFKFKLDNGVENGQEEDGLGPVEELAKQVAQLTEEQAKHQGQMTQLAKEKEELKKQVEEQAGKMAQMGEEQAKQQGQVEQMEKRVEGQAEKMINLDEEQAKQQGRLELMEKEKDTLKRKLDEQEKQGEKRQKLLEKEETRIIELEKKAMDEFNKEKEEAPPSSTTPPANEEEDKKWKAGDNCMAPYELDGKWYPAAIESISEGNGTCHIRFTGYDDAKATAKLSDLMREDEVEWIDEACGTDEQEEAREQHFRDTLKRKVEEQEKQGEKRQKLLEEEETKAKLDEEQRMASSEYARQIGVTIVANLQAHYDREKLLHLLEHGAMPSIYIQRNQQLNDVGIVQSIVDKLATAEMPRKMIGEVEIEYGTSCFTWPKREELKLRGTKSKVAIIFDEASTSPQTYFGSLAEYELTNRGCHFQVLIHYRDEDYNKWVHKFIYRRLP